jgi:mannose-6-phosphate isomerase-like protein (cupin superfamily)
MSLALEHFVIAPRDGATAAVSRSAPRTLNPGLLPGHSIHTLWGCDDVPRIGSGPTAPTFAPYFPGPGGVRVVLVRFPPDGGPGPQGEPADLIAEAERLMPGAVAALAPDEAGLHATDTVDVNLVLEGELWLELEDGAEQRLRAGSAVVLHGARHAWHNRGDVPALLASVMVGARRTADDPEQSTETGAAI